MGEYGTPNIDIEEGYIDDRPQRPRATPASTRSCRARCTTCPRCTTRHNIHFACRIWGLRATDLNQGVVYGIETDETAAATTRLVTRFDYDEVFGTVLNRFCVQAVIGHPLTVYGEGGQTRGYLNIRDTLQCVELAVANPAGAGELRVFNQFTEQFSVLELAELRSGRRRPPRAARSDRALRQPARRDGGALLQRRSTRKLLDLGLQPRLLSEELIDTMIGTIERHADQVNRDIILQGVKWVPDSVAEVAAAGR